MDTKKRDLSEAALHFVLAANYLAHDPTSPHSVVAAVCYMAMVAVRLSKENHDDSKPQPPESDGQQLPKGLMAASPPETIAAREELPVS